MVLVNINNIFLSITTPLLYYYYSPLMRCLLLLLYFQMMPADTADTPLLIRAINTLYERRHYYFRHDAAGRPLPYFRC